MSPGPELDSARDTTVRWVQTLVEPLLPLDRRTWLEEGFRSVCVDHPAWSGIVLAGTLADMMQTLPVNDPWRRAGARLGRWTAGERPPKQDGAVLPNGISLGTWRAFLDTFGAPSTEETIDEPSYAPVHDGLPPVAAAVLASGAHGWSTAREVLTLAANRAEPTSALHDLIQLPGTRSLQPAPVWTYGVPALKWAIHRRRSYGTGVDDPWVQESIFRWTWRAGRVLAGGEWDSHMVTPRIEAETLEDLDTDLF